MSNYRCYFLNHEDHIHGIEHLLDYQTDDDATETSLKLLDERTNHHGIEVWDGSRMVMRHLKGGAST